MYKGLGEESLLQVVKFTLFLYTCVCLTVDLSVCTANHGYHFKRRVMQHADCFEYDIPIFHVKLHEFVISNTRLYVLVFKERETEVLSGFFLVI